MDTRFEIRGEREPPRDLVVVEIDDVTFQELDRRWPFPRRIHARAVKQIAADDPRVIAYDVQFTERTAFEDEFALLLAIDGADGKVVLATTEVEPARRDEDPRRRRHPEGGRRAAGQRRAAAGPGRGRAARAATASTSWRRSRWYPPRWQPGGR